MANIITYTPLHSKEESPAPFDHLSHTKKLDQEKAAVNSKIESAASTLQKFIRGFNAREPLLPNELYPKYKEACALASNPEKDSIPRAEHGKIRVYIPKNVPEVVLKNSGRHIAVKRFHQMQKVRKILEAQGSTHLVIPKANLCQEFLVEQRLPINTDSLYNMGLYLAHTNFFDDAVREMTRLYSKVYVDDLVNRQVHPLSRMDGVDDMIRYDNLPLYIEEQKDKKVGKIGLIDLERIEDQNIRLGSGKVSITKDSHVETLVRIFPLHADIIKEEAAKLNMEFKASDFKTSLENGKKYFQMGYIDHLNWLKAKGITSESATNSIQINQERVKEIQQVVEKEWLKLNAGVNDFLVRIGAYGLVTPPKNFLKEDSEKVVKDLTSEVVTLILANLNSILKNEQIQPPNSELSEAQMISVRSPLIKRKKIFKDLIDFIEKSATINREFFDEDDSEWMAEQLAYVVLKELERGGEIYYYDSGEYTIGYNVCWIRY